MTAGVSTPPEIRAKFRAEFLYSGNAAESARKVGIPERTGQDLAKALEEDEDFAAARAKLRTSALDRLVAMRMRVAEKAAQRFENDGVEVAGNAENVTVIDKRPDYGRLVMEAEKNAQHLARYDAEREGLIATSGQVNINVSPTAAAATRAEKPDE